MSETPKGRAGRASRLTAAVAVLGLLAGCGWDIRMGQPQANASPSQPTPSERLGYFRNSPYYLTIYATMRPAGTTPTGDASAASLCDDDVAASILRNRHQTAAVALQMSQGSQAVTIPLLSISSQNSNDCSREYRQVYVQPRIQILEVPGSFYGVDVRTLASTKASENVSGFLQEAGKLVQTFAGPQPAVAGFDKILQSPVGQQVIQRVNQALSQSRPFGAPLLTLEGGATSRVSTDYVFPVSLVETPNDKVTPMATLTVSLRWARSAIAADSGDLRFDDSASPFTGLIYVFNGVSFPAAESVQALLTSRDPAGYSQLTGFQRDTPADTIRLVCQGLRARLPEFNSLDQAAILWIAYRETRLARSGNLLADKSIPECLGQDEIRSLTDRGLRARS